MTTLAGRDTYLGGAFVKALKGLAYSVTPFSGHSIRRIESDGLFKVGECQAKNSPIAPGLM